MISIISLSSAAAQEVAEGSIPGHFENLALDFPSDCLMKGPKVPFLALTFDDGPSKVTEEVLDILKKHNAKATFFWQGQNLAKHPELVRRAINEGHQLANHSWDHPNFEQLSHKQLWEEQINPTTQSFDSLYNYKVRFFRPPYGSINAEQVKFLSEKRIQTVLWSLSTLDWDPQRNATRQIVDRFKVSLHPGAIVLMHDVDFENTHQNMLKGLEEIIEYGRSQNFGFITLSSLLKQSNK